MRAKFKITGIVGLLGMLFLVQSGNVEGAVIFQPSLGVFEAYSDNIFFVEEDPAGDFVSLLSPGLKLGYQNRDFSLSGTYTGTAEFFARFPDQNFYSQGISIDLGVPFLNRQIKGFEIRITEDLSYSPELPGVSYVEDPKEFEAGQSGEDPGNLGEGVQLGRSDVLRNRAGVGISYPFSSGLETSMLYENIVTLYRESEFQDTRVHRVGFGENYSRSFSSRATWGGFYKLSLTYYEDNVSDDAAIHQTGLKLTYLISRLTTVNGRVGVAFVSSESPRYVSGVELIRRLRAGRISLNYSNNVKTGEGVIKGVVVRQTLRTTFKNNFTERSSFNCEVAYSSNRSASGGQVDVSIFTAGTGFEFNFFPWLSGEIKYSFLNQKSDGEVGSDARRNLVFAGFTASGR